MPAAHRCLTLHWRSEVGIGRHPLESSTNSFVYWAILRVDEAGTRAASVGAPPAFPAQRFRSWGYTVGERGLVLGMI